MSEITVGTVRMSDGTSRPARCVGGVVQFRTFANINSVLGHAWRKASVKQAETFAADPVPDDRGVRMGLGHVAPASVERWHAEALDEDAKRNLAAGVRQARTWWDRHNLDDAPAPISDAVLAAVQADHAEAADIEARAICASIPIDGRPAEVTELLTAAELLTDEHDHLAAVRLARKAYDEHLAN